MQNGIELIASERERQIEKKGFTVDHDDVNENKRQLARAAESYISHYTARAWTFTNELRLNIEDGPATYHGERAPDPWPWAASDWKPKSPLEDLIRAGALIAAEIDRLQRQAASLPSDLLVDATDAEAIMAVANSLPESTVGREKGMVTCPICESIILHKKIRLTGTFGGSAEVTARCPKCRRDVLFGYVDIWHVKDDVAFEIADASDDDSHDPMARTMPRLGPANT